MTLALADPFAGTLAARDTSVAWMTFMGIPQQTDGIDTYSDLESYAKAPADEAWVYACVARIFNAATSVPRRVYVRMGKDLVPWEDQPSPEAEDLQYLLDNANPVDMTGAELIGYSAAARKVWGGWYWKKVKGKYGGPTQELYWLRVPDLKPHSDDGRTIQYYDYRPHPTGQGAVASAEQYKPNEIIRRRVFNLGSQIDTLSPLSAARFEMVTEQAGSMHTASMLRRRGVPEGYWTATKGTELTTQDRSAIRRFLRQLVGPRNAGKSLVAPDIEFKPISLNEKDAEWLNGRKVSRMTVCAVLGVPLVLAGDDEKAGVYASVRDAQKVFWKDTMIPELDADAEAINNWLVPEFQRPNGPKLVVGFDYSTVEAIKPLWVEEWNGWLAAISAQVTTPNKFIDHFRLGDHVPWGDKPVPRTQVTLRPMEDPSQVGSLLADIPFTGPTAATPSTDVVTGAESPEQKDLGDSLRTIGKRLYSQVAVRAFLDRGKPLDLTFLGPVDPAQRAVIEDGLRRRRSAAQIAESLPTTSPAHRGSDAVTEAVLAALRKQWPEQELDIVREGSWTYNAHYPLRGIDAARRPIARNPKVVAGVEAALKVGAPISPVVVIDRRAVGKPNTEPIDGWHRILAAEHANLSTVPAYIGSGDEAWTKALLAFDQDIPTPPDSGGRSVQDGFVAALRSLADPPIVNVPAPIVNLPEVAAPIVNIPAPVVNIPAPVVNVTNNSSDFAAALREVKEAILRPRIKEVVRDGDKNILRTLDTPVKAKKGK